MRRSKWKEAADLAVNQRNATEASLVLAERRITQLEAELKLRKAQLVEKEETINWMARQI